jgi:hypothetical protein
MVVDNDLDGDGSGRGLLDAVYRLSLAEVKFTLEQATNGQKGSRGIALLFL